MSATEPINSAVSEFLESLVYSLDVDRLHSGAIVTYRVYLESQDLFCSRDIMKGLQILMVSGESVDGFYNIANLVKARGRFSPRRFQASSRVGDAITLNIDGELFLDEAIDVRSLLKIAHLVKHDPSNNEYSIKVSCVENQMCVAGTNIGYYLSDFLAARDADRTHHDCNDYDDNRDDDRSWFEDC